MSWVFINFYDRLFIMNLAGLVFQFIKNIVGIFTDMKYSVEKETFAYQIKYYLCLCFMLVCWEDVVSFRRPSKNCIEALYKSNNVEEINTLLVLRIYII